MTADTSLPSRARALQMESPSAPLLAALAGLVPALLQRDGDGLAIKDAGSGNYLHLNSPMLDWLGYTSSEVLGRGDAALFAPDVVTALANADAAALAQSGPTLEEHRFDWCGAQREFSVLRQRLDAVEGQVMLAAVWRDLAPMRQLTAAKGAAIEQLEQQQRANEQLRREFQNHPLREGETGLYNQGHFEDQLRREVDLSTREHREFALVSIEIDPFAPEVAALGDASRLRVYEAVARLLRSNTRVMDASCRIGDRRFSVLLSGVGLATAHSRMEGLRRQCATQIVVHEGREFGFTASMGVASFPHTAQSQVALRDACDAALAEARQRGGNHVTLASIRFDPA